VWTHCREELERKNGVTGANQERRRFFTSKHTHQFEFGARIRGKGSCFARYYSYSSYYVLCDHK